MPRCGVVVTLTSGFCLVNAAEHLPCDVQRLSSLLASVFQLEQQEVLSLDLLHLRVRALCDADSNVIVASVEVVQPGDGGGRNFDLRSLDLVSLVCRSSYLSPFHSIPSPGSSLFIMCLLFATCLISCVLNPSSGPYLLYPLSGNCN